ncbi:threonine-phosphate decarboxylase CobD [sulfur-oxidizing endosymbiont of Gigantopelta aegis]|uniref:threonine-phosphate decarboxylase CobD n=1 Tax=sulfur-oxidizing endosymbiont of Gigantopelta aegis TaxID=2794934 RepID=UPI0018DD2BD9|nr:threonine-phosphate decarboxylase CobD [sulfur-oxidizing endosymbiont of Gigantopelta aegis]
MLKNCNSADAPPKISSPKPSSLKHGGRLNQAVKQYALEHNQVENNDSWLDLSTGINPNGWPVPTLPENSYNRLPEDDDGLVETACEYYQTQKILPVAGSQEAIQLLPFIFQHYQLLPDQAKVGIISPCYAEHEFQWRKNNFTIVHLNTQNITQHIDNLDVLLVINPNNPTGELISKKNLQKWLLKLRQKNAYLIIDEAFMDSIAEQSLIQKESPENLIVLRSVGKFFGLAGVRCGFVIAPEKILNLLHYHQGPWSVSGPARWVVKHALADQSWIKSNKSMLEQSATRLENTLRKHLTNDLATFNISGTVLYQTLYIDTAEQLFEQLCQQKILVRLLDKSCHCDSCLSQSKHPHATHQGLRFGLPKNHLQWQHLESALTNIFSAHF